MVVSRVTSTATEVVGGVVAVGKIVHRLGLTSPIRPDKFVAMIGGARRWGMGPASVYAMAAVRNPDGIAVIDERESVTFADVDRRSTIVAAGLHDMGVTGGDSVALLARNSAAFIIAMVALAKVGANVLYANTGFAGPQLADVMESEKTTAIIADDEFAEAIAKHAKGAPYLKAWVEDGSAPKDSIAGLVAAAEGKPTPELPKPDHESKQIILTSGTTGRPKGAARGSTGGGLSGVISGLSFLDAIPYKSKGVTVLAAPAFHAWGLGNVTVGMLMQSTFVMCRKFDPENCLKLVEKHRADTIAAVPVMAQRMLDVENKPDTSSLRIVALSGSALAPTLAQRFMDNYGEVLYSLYGSTEIAYVSVAGPQDLRDAPTTAGQILRGVTVRIVDDKDEDVPPGEVGRIFAGSGMTFEGYTNGDNKDRLGNLASIGDLGRIGEDGRLYVEGRDDDMIVSGGENVFPAEVEDTLHKHPDVLDVAVVGIEDEKFGQALVAHVVLRDGASSSESDLRKHVKSELANYKVPREIVFHDKLPRNETGKVLKRELREAADDAEEKDADTGDS
jgi:fatty-acyl-CoA synthase